MAATQFQTDQYTDASITTAKVANNAIVDGKLAVAVQNVLPDRLKLAWPLILSRTLTTGTAQPLPLTDATFTGKSAGGAVNGAGTSGIVAGSFATSAAETGTAATQAGLGSAAASGQPYNATDFAGNQYVECALFKADGDEVTLQDLLSTAVAADRPARVYCYLSYRSDLGADAKWRCWFYYRRASDGLEAPFTPDTSLTNCTLLCAEVGLLKDGPVARGIGQQVISSQAAPNLSTKSILTAMLDDLAVTTAKVAASAVTHPKLDADVHKKFAQIALRTPATPSAAEPGFVVGSGAEGQVTAQGTPNMTVKVDTAPRAYNELGNLRLPGTAASIAIATADVTNPRDDIIVVNDSEAYAVRQGTPGASPVDPTLTAGDVALARVRVGAGVTTIVAGNITDLRRRTSLDGAKLVALTVPGSALEQASRDRLGGAYDVQKDFTGDGAAVNFDLDHADGLLTMPGCKVWKNGTLQRSGTGNDYTYSDNGGAAGVDRIVFATAPASGAWVHLEYKRTAAL